MLDKARDLSAAGTWFLTVRVAEVGVLVLVVSALLDARSAWQVGAQYTGDEGLGSATPEVSLMQRITGMALFGGYRGPVSLLVVAMVLAGLLVVLHRCQPVRHTRVLRWEWLSLWAVATLLAFVASAVCLIALFGDDPYASDEPGVVRGSVGPGFHEQVIGSLSWPLASLLLLLPLGLWWARLPDMDDLEDALEEAFADREAGTASSGGALPTEAGVMPEVGGAVPSEGAPRSVGGPRAGRFRRPAGDRPPRRGRQGDDDAIFVDDVEQIEPVERLSPRGADRGDGSSVSGYDGYFRRP